MPSLNKSFCIKCWSYDPLIIVITVLTKIIMIMIFVIIKQPYYAWNSALTPLSSGRSLYAEHGFDFSDHNVAFSRVLSYQCIYANSLPWIYLSHVIIPGTCCHLTNKIAHIYMKLPCAMLTVITHVFYHSKVSDMFILFIYSKPLKLTKTAFIWSEI